MKYLSRAIVLGLLLAGCTGKNPESEQALNAVTLLSRSQEAFYVEHGRFTEQIDELKIDWLNLQETTPNYRYQFRLFNEQNTIGVITTSMSSRGDYLIGIVSKTPNSQTDNMLCRGRTMPPQIIKPGSCPSGFVPVDLNN